MSDEGRGTAVPMGRPISNLLTIAFSTIILSTSVWKIDVAKKDPILVKALLVYLYNSKRL